MEGKPAKPSALVCRAGLMHRYRSPAVWGQPPFLLIRQDPAAASRPSEPTANPTSDLRPCLIRAGKRASVHARPPDTSENLEKPPPPPF